ncbi:hypothetical protein PRK78_006803 [Emydomyces testavorans]|uniref:EKC/KEOPS complex subunit BUD32 n=1 Tax=Emydomyces testavorans TaxID=2070801 RepID=A0AAF0DN69_9EURO|nr:hypothetical protein PRK78_006803 [Emydomyces testavorans]
MEPHPENHDHITYRTCIINSPADAKILFVAGYSAICEREGRPGVLLKVPLPFPENERAMEIEKQVYRRLGKHPNLVEVTDIDEWGIYLKKAEPGCLRLYYDQGGVATPEERLKWCRDLAQVLHYVHENGIRHADLAGKNLLVDSSRNILLCDFSGSSVDGETAIIIAGAGFRHPDREHYRPPTVLGEIHALGPTIYEIVTGRKPFHEKTSDQDREVDELTEQGKYPDVSKLPLGDVIAKCWKRDGFFNSAADVAEEIARQAAKANYHTSAPRYLVRNGLGFP